ncbi:MAG: gliding motility lipoprotein GldH [Bacteroidales bacterium]
MFMKAFRLMVFLTTILTLLSCNKVFSDREIIENYQWNSENVIKFSVDIKEDNTNIPLQLILNLRYIQGIPYQFLKLRVYMIDPNGEKNYQDLEIQLIDSEKNYIGEGIGDYWDIDFPIDEKLIFNKTGSYKFEFEHLMDENPVRFVNEIGITLKK